MSNPFLPPVTTIGHTHGRPPHRAFGIYLPDRLTHTWIIGQTGTGKTTLLKHLAMQDITNSQGFVLIDPHGDLARELQAHLPPNAIYWDLADPDNPYGYNPLSPTSSKYRALVCSGLIDALRQQFSNAWGPRMEHLLRFALLTLLEAGGGSLENIAPLFTDKTYRTGVLQRVQDPLVLQFWNKEFTKLSYLSAGDGVAPIANKLSGFLAHPQIRTAFCYPTIPLRFRTIMNEGTVVVINLSKGKLGVDTSNLAGGLTVSMIAHAAYSRLEDREDTRRPFFLYLDEFHNFSTEAFAPMLSELRKCKLGLVLAHQTTSQLKPLVLDAIVGNVGTQIVFTTGAKDAPVLCRILDGPHETDLLNQPNHHFYIRLMIKGVRSRVFSARTIT